VDTGTSLRILKWRRLVFLKRVFCFYEKVEAASKSNKELSDNKLAELHKQSKAKKKKKKQQKNKKQKKKKKK